MSASSSKGRPIVDLKAAGQSSSDAPFKPKFLTKAEREKRALEKRESEMKEQREHEQRERQQREEYERKARSVLTSESASGQNDRRRHGDRDSGRRQGYEGRPNRHDDLDYGNATNHDRRTVDRRPGAPSHGADREAEALRKTDLNEPLTEAEQDLIRNKYLGIKAPAKKRSRAERKKLAFDWDTTDDTSDRTNPAIFDTHVEAKAFGYGARAGMDASQRNGHVDGVGNGSGNPTGDPLRRGAKSAFAEKHWSEKSLDEMRERDWRIFREDFGISSKGGHIPKPLRSWRESLIPGPILDVVAQIGYKEPSPIQRQAIPIGLQNRDLIGIAETGSGKTASFVIPMLSYISKLPRLSDANRHLGPYALIIAPTRELAQQIEGETKKFTDPLGYTCVSIVGGRDMNDQSFSLRNGAEIIVATPGRLKDCIERHILVLSQCLYLVLDEADKSIGLGFADVLDYILDSMPASNLKPDTEEAENPLGIMETEGTPRYRVTMLYSATMPSSVERLAKTYLRRPATITIGDANQAVGTVEQRVEFIAGDDKKRARIGQILSSHFAPPMIVFSTTISSVDSLAHELRRQGFNVTTLHSKKTQSQREASLDGLRSGAVDILVATDLAGRGIDVPNVSAVINYSFPTSFEAYIHRIGRTGRAGKKGIAFTFVDPQHDSEFFYDLKQELSRSPISTVPRELERHPAAQSRLAVREKRKRDEE